ncbi:NAD(P)/FAD-dependent oxidoreductase [candidate division KSB1 bacterium]|nr:NAD(P)/FAD-dependent oxidoreductase [candidate division KSB1 bacterium]
MNQRRGRIELKRVVIIGGGFGGIYAAKSMKKLPVEVKLIDRRNFHLFQPFLYQVATGGLSSGDIAQPIRTILRRNKNTEVIQAEVVDIDPERKKIIMRDGEMSYDKLVISTGSSHHYFGHEDWAQKAPSLKTVENALDIRRRILLAFEAAERESDPVEREAWLTFLIVGAGPTGVELSGTLGELARKTLRDEFRNFNPESAKIMLVEGLESALPGYPDKLSRKAERALKKRGVTVRTGTMVTEIDGNKVTLTARDDSKEKILARTIVWAAGVKASNLGHKLAERANIEINKSGQVKVRSDLTVPDYPDIFVIGDLAYALDRQGEPLPGLGAVAMQQGRYVARSIKRQMKRKRIKPFRYWDRGKMAFIGLNAAIVDISRLHFNGFLGWLFWVFVHIYFLIGFNNKLLVLTQWAWNYFTRKRGARLIIGSKHFPVLTREADEQPQITEYEPTEERV